MNRCDFFRGTGSALISGVAATRAYSFLNGAGLDPYAEHDSLWVNAVWAEAIRRYHGDLLWLKVRQ